MNLTIVINVDGRGLQRDGGIAPGATPQWSTIASLLDAVRSALAASGTVGGPPPTGPAAGGDGAAVDEAAVDEAAADDAAPGTSALPSAHPLLVQLVAGWLPGWEDDTADQPDRAELLGRFVTPGVVVWVREVGGLTAAVGAAVSALRGVVPYDGVEPVGDEVRARLSSWTVGDTRRLSANIAQVASLLRPELSALFTDFDK